MRKIGLLLVVASLLMLVQMVPNAQASDICDLDHLPSYPSANSSMILIIPERVVLAEMVNFTDPMKVSYWVSPKWLFDVIDDGGMHPFQECWICEFSGKISDFYGNCGPSPFHQSGEYQLDYRAKDFYRYVEFNRSILISSEEMFSAVNVDTAGDVHITVDAPANTKEVWVSLYDTSTGDLVSGFDRSGLTESEIKPGRYFMDITSLGKGSYYASFGFETDAGRKGGGVSHFEITEGAFGLSVKTNKDSYWLGEEVVISGQTLHDRVSGSVRLPSGGSVPLGSKNVVSGQYSFTFKLQNNYAAGQYEVTVSAPGSTTAKKAFTVEKVLVVSPLSLDFTVTNKSGVLRKTVSVQNLGDSTVSLSYGSEDITNHVSLSLDDGSVDSQSTSTLTVTLDPAQITTSMTGRVLISGNGATFPVDVSITLALGGGSGEGGSIGINPGFFETDNCMVGKSIEPSFTLQNNGKTVLSGFTHTLSTDLDDITDVTLPSSLSADSYDSMDLEITPDKREISGWVRVSSGDSSETVYIILDCIPDVEDDIYNMQSDVDSLKASFSGKGFSEEVIGSIFNDLDYELSSARTDLDSGDYDLAIMGYNSAVARLDALETVAYEIDTTQPVDLTWVVWVVVIVILAVVGYFVYTKFGSKLLGGLQKKGEEESEEDLEEELY